MNTKSVQFSPNDVLRKISAQILNKQTYAAILLERKDELTLLFHQGIAGADRGSKAISGPWDNQLL
jgi:hypothetical protein